VEGRRLVKGFMVIKRNTKKFMVMKTKMKTCMVMKSEMNRAPYLGWPELAAETEFSLETAWVGGEQTIWICHHSLDNGSVQTGLDVQKMYIFYTCHVAT
jgi:hypothetical protein